LLSISNSNIQVLNLLNARIIYQILRRHASWINKFNEGKKTYNSKWIYH
jgi:hypothetical protein